MPLDKDPNGGGTEADGSKSKKFCGYCYQNGKYTTPDISFDDMKKMVKKKMKENGASWFLIWMSMITLPKLERWKKS